LLGIIWVLLHVVAVVADCRPGRELTDFTREALIFIVAPDGAVDEIMRVLIDSASTAQSSDGFIWVTEVGEAFDICKVRESRSGPQRYYR
jgi:nitrogen regulatory protein PII